MMKKFTSFGLWRVFLLLPLFMVSGCGYTVTPQEVYDEPRMPDIVQQNISRDIRLYDYIELGISTQAYMDIDWQGLGEGQTYTASPASIGQDFAPVTQAPPRIFTQNEPQAPHSPEIPIVSSTLEYAGN